MCVFINKSYSFFGAAETFGVKETSKLLVYFTLIKTRVCTFASAFLLVSDVTLYHCNLIETTSSPISLLN